MSNSEENQEVQEESLIKAGLRKGYFTLVEGVYDPGILKAVFLAGGPGAGKSAVVDTVFNVAPDARSLTSTGLKIVNSDSSFEHLLKKVHSFTILWELTRRTFWVTQRCQIDRYQKNNFTAF